MSPWLVRPTLSEAATPWRPGDSMDRIDTVAIADAHGIVHIAVGQPGERVHVVVEPAAPGVGSARILAAFDEARRPLEGRVWAEPEEVARLRHEGHDL